MSSAKFENGKVMKEGELASYAKKARLEAKLTQIEAGEALGVDQARISHAENPSSSRNETGLRLRMIEEFTEFSVCPVEREFELSRKD